MHYGSSTAIREGGESGDRPLPSVIHDKDENFQTNINEAIGILSRDSSSKIKSV